MNRFIPMIAAAAIALGGVVLWQSGAPNATSLPTIGAANAQAAEDVDKSLVKEMTLGDEAAPVKVIEYASATCPHCKNFHQNTFKEFKTNYIDTGKVHFTYREVYFDRFGLWAGLVARCGGGDKYFGIMDMVFAQQSTWTKGETPVDIADNLARIGRTAGLTSDEIDACMQDEAMAQAMIAVFQENAEADGVRSTPSFLINGTLVPGDQSYAAFSSLVDAELN